MRKCVQHQLRAAAREIWKKIKVRNLKKINFKRPGPGVWAQTKISSSYYALYDVFDDDRYFNHFMLLNKAIHSLYSSTASEDDIDIAKYEIDLFLSVLNVLDYSDAFFQYNTHLPSSSV